MLKLIVGGGYKLHQQLTLTFNYRKNICDIINKKRNIRGT